MLNKLSEIVIIFLLISSCEKENKLETKESLTQLKNFEIKNTDKHNYSYSIKGKNAFSKDNTIFIDNLDISFKNSKYYVKGNSLSAKFFDKNSNITINNVFLENKDLKLKNKGFIVFNQNNGIKDSTEIEIISKNINIKGINLKTDKNFKKFYLKKIKAKISY